MVRSFKTVAELIAEADAEYSNSVAYSVKLSAFKRCMEKEYKSMFQIEKFEDDVVNGQSNYLLPADCRYEDILVVFVDDTKYYPQEVMDRWTRGYTYKRYISPLYPDREYITLYPEPTTDSTDGLVIHYYKIPFFMAWGINPDGQLAHKNLAIYGRDGRLNNELVKDGDFEVDAGSGIATGFTANSAVGVTYSISDEFVNTGNYSQKAASTADDKYLTYDIEFYDNEASVAAAIVQSTAAYFVELKMSAVALGQNSNKYADEPQFIYQSRFEGEASKSGLDVYFGVPRVTYVGPDTSYVDSLIVVNLSRDFGYDEDQRPGNSDFIGYLQGMTYIDQDRERLVIEYIKQHIAKVQKDYEVANGFYLDYEEESDKAYEKLMIREQSFMDFDCIDRERRWR